MTIGFIAYHYPRPEHFAEFIERTRVVRETLKGQPGCRSVEIWATQDRDAVITSGSFESEQDYQRAFGVARALGDPVVFDDRERKSRHVVTLVSQ